MESGQPPNSKLLEEHQAKTPHVGMSHANALLSPGRIKAVACPSPQWLPAPPTVVIANAIVQAEKSSPVTNRRLSRYRPLVALVPSPRRGLLKPSSPVARMIMGNASNTCLFPSK